MDFAVRSTDARFLEILRDRVGEFRVEQGPDDILFSGDCGVAKTIAGGKRVRSVGRLYFGTTTIYRGRSQEEMAGRLIAGVRDWTTAHSNEFLRVRAGAVSTGDGALMLPSVPEPHLPALVALLVKSGAGYLGDEIVNVDPVFRKLHALSLPLLFAAQDLVYFPELGIRPARRRPDLKVQARPRAAVRLERLGGSLAAPTPARWIVFPTFRPDAATELVPMGRAEALFAFSQALLNAHIWRDRAFVLMQDLLGGAARVSRLVVGSLPDAAELLLDLVGRREGVRG